MVSLTSLYTSSIGVGPIGTDVWNSTSTSSGNGRHTGRSRTWPTWSTASSTIRWASAATEAQSAGSRVSVKRGLCGCSSGCVPRSSDCASIWLFLYSAASWKPGVDRDSSISSASMSAGIVSNSGVDR